MEKFRVKISKGNITTEVIMIAENTSHISEFIKLISNNTIKDDEISYPTFTDQEKVNFKRLME